MGGVIGATSGKFVLIGAALLLQGRVDNARTEIAIVPGLAYSAVTEGFARRNSARLLKIAIRATSFTAPVTAVDPGLKGPAEVELGRDVLDAHPIEIDFGRHQVRSLLKSEAQQAERRSTAIPVEVEPDGLLRVPLTLSDHRVVSGELDLRNADTVIATAAMTGVPVQIGGKESGARSVEQMHGLKVGLGIFWQSRIIFDLGDNKIFVRS